MTGIFQGFRKKTEEEPQVSFAELFPPYEDEECEGAESDGFTELPVDMIDPNPGQPRRYFDGEALMSLSESIKSYGILQPLSVTYQKETGRYTLVAGERRLRAAKLLGMERVPAIIINADPRRSEELAIIENIQREDLNIFEEARAIASLITKYELTQEEAASKLSVSQSYVANKLRLLKLSRNEIEYILEAGLTERHARAILRIKEPTVRMSALRQIVTRGMNVAMAEEYIDRLLMPKEEAKEHSGQKVKMGIRDIKLFCNSIDRAVDTIKRAGVPVSTSRTDAPDHTEIVISIPNR
ncbi:MAG: ParB/RepB/Spo0J family partition protein [Ruminococcaceae bacterium]|nr:ParB/RepB/Spo0J family partition protein [Oscillospiraceae bacterium]